MYIDMYICHLYSSRAPRTSTGMNHDSPPRILPIGFRLVGLRGLDNAQVTPACLVVGSGRSYMRDFHGNDGPDLYVGNGQTEAEGVLATRCSGVYTYT